MNKNNNINNKNNDLIELKNKLQSLINNVFLGPIFATIPNAIFSGWYYLRRKYTYLIQVQLLLGVLLLRDLYLLVSNKEKIKEKDNNNNMNNNNINKNESNKKNIKLSMVSQINQNKFKKSESLKYINSNKIVPLESNVDILSN